MSISLTVHPSWILYQASLGGITFCTVLWDLIPGTKYGMLFLAALLMLIILSFWGSWRLLTNALDSLPKDSLWSNAGWWLFLFSFPLPLFLSVFCFPGDISSCLSWIGFVSIIAVAILSGRILPFPKGIVFDDEGTMSISLSAFCKSKKQIIPVRTITPVLQAVVNNSATELRAALQKHPEYLNTAYAQNGNTPLHVAALNGQTEIVRLLLEQPGIDKTVKNNNGQTAADLAQEKGFAEIAGLLRNK